MIALLWGVVGMMNGYTQNLIVGDLIYSINDDGVSVTIMSHKDYSSATGSLVIPESIVYEGNNYVVTAIGEYAFYYCTRLTGNLVIPTSITTIGESAFYNCGFTEVHYNATNCADIGFSNYG